MKLAVILASLATAAHAERLQTVADVAARIAGTEIAFQGSYGILNDDPSLVMEGEYYPVELAVDRDTLNRLRDCTLTIFGEGGCAISGAAEIRIDGSRIILGIYSVE